MGSLRPSGMERMLVSAGSYFAAAGCQSVVVAQGDKNPYAAEIAEAGYRVVEIPWIKSGPRGMIEWARLLKRWNPHVVHIHAEEAFGATAPIARLAARQANVVRSVLNVFDAQGWWWAKRTLQCRVTDRYVNTFVAPSPDVAENERRFGRGCMIIENWVDDRFASVATARRGPRTPPLVMMVGNCSQIKNHELALEALSGLEDVHVVHLGSEDGCSARETRLMDELAARGRLVFRGVSDTLPFLEQASLYLMPSMHEGMSVAFLEALVAGVPSVVSDSAGMRWASAIPGVLVVPDPDPLSWRGAISRHLLASPPIPRALAERFSASRGASQYMDVYGREGGLTTGREA